MMYISERQHHLIDEHQPEPETVSPMFAVVAEWSLRLLLLMGFIIVLSIEGWLLIRMLVQ